MTVFPSLNTPANLLSRIQATSGLVYPSTSQPKTTLKVLEPHPLLFVRPSEPILLNLISLYLLYATAIQSQAFDNLNQLSLGTATSVARSFLSWIPALSIILSDSLLTPTYSALDKLCLSEPKTAPSPKSTPFPAQSKPTISGIKPRGFDCIREEHPGERRRTDD
ncbi:hypothetical protein CPC08DRAFT_764030 [Agrocybe pediades]|nr:hypothetical protein CPC08DRAFT_764030 [Agrocybe pediades]